MRFLGVGDTNDLADMYLRLARRGHEVRVYVGDPAAHDVLEGTLARTADWRSELSWVRAAGDDGVILFENATSGVEQDRLRADGYRVIGGCAFGDRLEGERDFAQATLRELGMRTAPTHRFNDFGAAIRFVQERRGRWVFKLNGNGWSSTRTYIGELDDGADLCAVLRSQRDRWAFPSPPDFILMQQVRGVEVGVGAYFNGQDFLTPACLDWEHKRFFPGDLGELTGEMGTLVTYQDSDALFKATLHRLAPRLRANGYVGYINLNTIVNAEGVWPLELTCRFGYPGFAILDSLQRSSWDEIWSQVLAGRDLSLRTRPGWAVGVVLTIPPFPYPEGREMAKGAPIWFRAPLSAAHTEALKLGEVRWIDEQWVSAGTAGYLMVATGRGATVPEAQRDAYSLVDQVVIPKLRYRNDIGDAFVRVQHAEMKALGWLP